VPAEIWILLLVLASAIAAWAGFFYARRGVPTQAQLDALRNELAAAQQKAEKVQADVTGHFEQSAVLFGRLAHDYRAFLEHFSTSAQELGISESMARELLQRADQPLLGQDADVVDTQPAEHAETPTLSADEAAESSADMLAESQLPEAKQAAQGEAEPPLMEDVVTGSTAADKQADTALEETPTTSRLVDVELPPSAEQSEPVDEKAEDMAEDKKTRHAG